MIDDAEAAGEAEPIDGAGQIDLIRVVRETAAAVENSVEPAKAPENESQKDQTISETQPEPKKVEVDDFAFDSEEFDENRNKR